MTKIWWINVYLPINIAKNTRASLNHTKPDASIIQVLKQRFIWLAIFFDVGITDINFDIGNRNEGTCKPQTYAFIN